MNRMVLYRFPDNEHAPNYTEVVPAIVTQFHGPDGANLRVISDGPPGGEEWRTSVSRCELNDKGEPEIPDHWAWPEA